MLKKIVRGVDYLINELSSSSYKYLEDYCFLESAANATTFVGEDGSLATILKINGMSKSIHSNSSMADAVEVFYSNCGSYFKGDGYVLQYYFARDHEQSEKLLTDLYNPYVAQAKRMGFDMDFFFDEKINKLKNYIIKEDAYIVLWTRPAAAKELEVEIEKNRKNLANAPLFEKAQDTFKVYKSLMQKHEGYINSIMRGLKAINIYSKVLSVKDGGRDIKRSVDIGRVGDNWHPRVYVDAPEHQDGNKPIMKDPEERTIKKNDISYFLYPKLKTQLIPSQIEFDENCLLINDKWVKTFYMKFPQEQPTKFSDLIGVIPDDIPFQISFKLMGGGLSKVGIKKMMATILTFDATSDNRYVKDSLKYYLELEKKQGLTVSKNNVTVNVFAKTKDDVNRNANILSSELQNWGSPMFVEDNSDSYEMFFNAIPAFTPKIPMQSNFILPLDEMLFTLPFNRMLNLEERGLITYRTEDKKMINYNPMSDNFNYFNEFIVATPGSGKSVKSNVNNLSFVFQKKSSNDLDSKIPLIFIIDIGPSSKGFIEFLRLCAPKHLQHMFHYQLIENSKEQTVNILDTPLGCRRLPEKLNSLVVSFLSMLTTPIDEKATDDMLVNKLIMKAYQRFSDRGRGVRVVGSEAELKGMHPNIYKEIIKNKIKVNPKTKWWELVDTFFKLGDLRMAKLCQIQAVPTLIDLIEVIKSEEEFKEMYGDAEINRFVRLVSESLDLYPIFNGRTVLDLSEARVLSFDLNDVAPDGKGDKSAAKKSALMYTFSTIYGLRNFFYEKNTKKNAPSLYSEYLDEQYNEFRNIPKRFVVDEFHRGASVEKFKAEVIRILRESRKWKMSNCLISQYLDDFAGEIRELCSARFILSSGSNYKKFQKEMDLDDDTAQILRTRLTGASSEGLPFVVDYDTKKGRFSQYLFSTLSGMELWATTSTSEDVQLLTKLESSFGIKDSIKILATEFSKGSIKDLIENDTTGKINVDNIVKSLKKKYANALTS